MNPQAIEYLTMIFMFKALLTGGGGLFWVATLLPACASTWSLSEQRHDRPIYQTNAERRRLCRWHDRRHDNRVY